MSISLISGKKRFNSCDIRVSKLPWCKTLFQAVTFYVTQFVFWHVQPTLQVSRQRHISDIVVFIRDFPDFAVTIDETKENF